MGFDLEISVPALTVFIQGILSFFSPCVLPLVPLYVGYLAGGAKTVEVDGTIRYPRGRVMWNTLFFVLGISATFFLLGFGFTALGQFFSDNRLWFARISGIIMVLFGLYQLGVFGHSMALEREHRLPFRLGGRTMGPLVALVLGFTFSFAWTPCVGPVLGSVLLMASSSASAPAAALLIGVYTLGFVLPFLAVGLFTGGVLSFFKRHQQVVRWTGKAGAALLILMGVMTFTGFMNGFTEYLSQTGSAVPQSQSVGSGEEPSASTDADNGASEPPVVPAPDFTLVDQYGEEHSLSDYKGKTIFLNFWATWCGPCVASLPHIQELYNKYHDKGFEVFCVADNDSSEDEWKNFIAGSKVGMENYHHILRGLKTLTDENGEFVGFDRSNDQSDKYAVHYLPTKYLIAADGTIIGKIGTDEELDSILAEIFAE